MIAIVKYNAGNIMSVKNAVERLGYECIITDDPHEIISADKVILPGVGEAGSAMKHLRERGLDEVIRNLRQPVLGICLGLQLLCKYSEEGDTECLGVFDAVVKKLPPGDKVPHMGWNRVNQTQSSKLFEEIKDGEHFYFANSFYVPVNEQTTSTCNYGVDFAASMEKENYYGVQFHPEKSGQAGIQLIKNFVELC